MKLTLDSIRNDKEAFEKAGFRLPEFDYVKVKKNTYERPTWIHFGAGNIFRAFQADLMENLLDQGLAKSGLIAAEGFDHAAFERAKRASLGARLRGFEDFDSVCLSSFDGARFGYSVFDAPAVLASVTEEECRAFLARVLTRERTALSVIKPGRS